MRGEKRSMKIFRTTRGPVYVREQGRAFIGSNSILQATGAFWGFLRWYFIVIADSTLAAQHLHTGLWVIWD